jgi:flavin reductase (DIM6/NTAB) family NADH-FMN oxidoreductase RutF
VKKIIPLDRAYRLLANAPLLIMASRSHARANIAAIAWSTPIEKSPPRLAIIVDSAHLTWENLLTAPECTVNIVGRRALRLAVYAGTVSGRECDKLAESKALAAMGSVVHVPILPECLANIECRVLSQDAETGLVLLEPVAAFADEEAFFDGWKMERGIFPIQHLGGDRFQCGSEVLFYPSGLYPPSILS